MDGQTIANRFTILGSLGSGSSGSVFRAFDTELHVELAIKLLSTDSVEFGERFRNEIVLARRLSHPNIVRFHEYGRTPDGKSYISMELVDGESLRQRLAHAATAPLEKPGLLRSGLTLDEAIFILSQTAQGIAYAHDKGIVHRDIKPDNILISRAGELKIADFGLARDTMQSAGITIFGQTVGTPYYMAPEQVRGEKAGPSADIYALGIIGFELCSGIKPFDGENSIAIALKHLSEPPPIEALETSGAPGWLTALVLKMVEKDASDRPASMHAVISALSQRGTPSAAPHTVRADLGDTVIDSGPMQAVTTRLKHAWSKSRRFLPQKQTTRAGALAAGAVALVAAGCVIVLSLQRTTGASKESEQPAPAGALASVSQTPSGNSFDYSQPRPKEYSSELCDTLTQTGMILEAIPVCEAVLAEHPDDGQTLLNQGGNYFVVRQWAKAKALYSHYRELFERDDPYNRSVLEARSQISQADSFIANYASVDFPKISPYGDDEQKLFQEIKDLYCTRGLSEPDAAKTLALSRKLWLPFEPARRLLFMVDMRDKLKIAAPLKPCGK